MRLLLLQFLRQVDRTKIFFVFINLCLWFPVLAASAEEYFSSYRSDWAFLGFMTIHAPFAIALYANWLVFIPKLLGRGRYGRYVFSMLGLALALSLASGMNPGFRSMVESSGSAESAAILGSAVITFGVILLIHLFTTPLFLSIGWFRQQNQIQELANANLQKEMAVLKAQFNPHFIFNSLNNIYSLALDRSELAPDMILRLSKLLRYTSYQGRRDWVDLSEEVRFLEDYLELQKIRSRNQQAIRFHSAIDQSYPVDVPPLLLILPIENAIKHGTESLGAAADLRIDLVQKDDWLSFRVSNRYDSDRRSGSAGIGLEQLRRRLQLRYGDDHELHIEDHNGHFDLRLEIPLRQAQSEWLDLAEESLREPAKMLAQK